MKYNYNYKIHETFHVSSFLLFTPYHGLSYSIKHLPFFLVFLSILYNFYKYIFIS